MFLAIPVIVLVISSTAIGLTLMSQGQAAVARRAAENAPRTGMDVLNAFSCGRGETKRIIVRGVEDNYSPAGAEPGFIREGRNHALSLPLRGDGEYDQVNVDQAFTDSIRIDDEVAGGIFLIRARSLNGSDNDGMAFGDLTIDPNTGQRRPHGRLMFSDQGSGAIWTRSGDVFYGDIAQLTLASEPRFAGSGGGRYSLKSYLNDSAGPGWLDVFVQDDTAVDFMGVALCYPPTVRRGTALMPLQNPDLAVPGVIQLVCHNVQDRADRCDPYVGNRVCSAILPVACLRPGHAPAPPRLALTWTGAQIAVTEPVRADRFRSVRDVEAFCAARFGPDWRVANLSDGFRYQSLAGRGDPGTVTGPVWVDVVSQPHATCWTHE